MQRNHFVCLSLAGLALALAAAGCSGSSSVTGPDAAPSAPVSGSAVVQGTVTGAGAGLEVGVVGTPLVTEVDDEGQFVLSGVPIGTAALKFVGAGIDARVDVPDLRDGLVTSITVQVSGGTARLTATPNCTPTAETAFSGVLEQIAGAQLVVGGRRVDASQVKKVWRDGRRIQLADLVVGEKLKVWGTLSGSGVVVAEEIEARTPGAHPAGWVAFKGLVESVSASALEVRANCESPTFVVAGRNVNTDAATRFKWSDGTALSPADIEVGYKAQVEGWDKGGSVLAAKMVVERR
jgi:hypothetical protein